MALLNRVGNILRQTVNKNINNIMSVASPCQMLRCMSINYKVIVGGLACATDDTSLREAFSPYGEISEARVIKDRETGRSRGFGFVTFTDPDAGFDSMVGMDQWELDGQTVSVSWANDTKDESEAEPFSLINLFTVRSNLVFDRWRNSEFDHKVLGPGMVLLKNYLTHEGQVDIVNMCQMVAMGPGGFYQPRNRSGAKLRLRMMCFGRNWDPVTKYEKSARSDGSTPPPLPCEFISLAENAIQDTQGHVDELPSMSPDICVANFYSIYDRIGLHQDCDEHADGLSRGLPVVSVSIGRTAEFLYGHTRDENKLERVLLESGDVLIFGGKSRRIFHGVRRILGYPGPSQLSQETGLRPGHLNLTLKQF